MYFLLLLVDEIIKFVSHFGYQIFENVTFMGLLIVALDKLRVKTFTKSYLQNLYKNILAGYYF